MDYRTYIAEKINVEGMSAGEIRELLMTPPDPKMGDFCLPCFKLAKTLRKPPQAIAESLCGQIAADRVIASCEAVSGYLNVRLNKAEAVKDLLNEILSAGDDYGKSDIGKGKTVCIDYSSINIAKRFHIGHLSTTVLGGALYRIFKSLGYRTVGINHLGDYGTQFGKLIVALKRWGDTVDLSGKDFIRNIQKIYVRFHQEAEKDPALEDEARMWFKKIEDHDPEATKIFEWLKAETLKEADKIYELLDVHFDSYNGESFYNDKMAPVLKTLEEKGLLVESQGARIVDLSAYDMPPCLLVKADGASLYATRDIAAAIYRKQTYDFDKCLYVVAYQQNLHFKQFFKVLELMGYEWAKDLEHIAFGMVSLEDGQSMSTRKGVVVYLEDVINKCIEKALGIIAEKNPALENKEEVAKQVGVGAVIFSALQSSRIKDIVFSYDRVLNFDGETGPYVQYTYARCNSVAGRAAFEPEKVTAEELKEEEFALASLLGTFPQTVQDAAERREPFYITRLVTEVAKAYNKFYYECRILGEAEGVMQRRLGLTRAAMQVLRSGLALLGIRTVDKM